MVGVPTASHKLFDTVAQGKEKQERRYRALRPVSPEDSRVFRVMLQGKFLVQGFRNRDLRQLFCVHGLIFKVARISYYRITKSGREIMPTAIKFRDSNVGLLAC